MIECDQGARNWLAFGVEVEHGLQYPGPFGGYHQVPSAQRLWIWATDVEQARKDLPLA
ncbi:hypothetical protein [Nonomuraea turcica]|uniref:hypothetical protein n=1 Tax=Nonomuraea sp. G32 TaxID=3067274 RepID=UPI00273BB498|nr:hypothetical protein [Nonomuraea sp. G32]MDP4502636.1 hypothetical protein [Nonomuraea sp. G32]